MGAWCPISGEECRDDCAWGDIVVTITDEGMEQDTFCCVTMLTAALVRICGEAEDSDHGFGTGMD